MKNKLLLISGLAAVGFLLYAAYQPDFTMDSYTDGTGIVHFGNKIVPFKKGETVNLKTWNGFELTVDGTTRSYSLKRFGQTIVLDKKYVA